MNADIPTIARLLLTQDEGALCLTPDNATATAIKKCINGSQRVPLIMPFTRLLAAAKRLPIDRHLPQGAALLEAESGESMTWRIYDLLRPYIKQRYSPAARLQLAQKLARLITEAEHYVSDVTQNPFAALTADGGGSYEANVAAPVWDELAKDDKMAVVSATMLQQLAQALPPVIAVCTAETPPLQRLFYQQCGAQVVEVATTDAAQQWQQAYRPDNDDDNAMPAVTDMTALQGTGATLAQTAQLAFQAVCEFLATAQEDEKIGIVVYDRLIARRLRAIAESQGVLIADNRGWRAESLVSGAALLQYAALLLEEFNIDALAGVLGAPFYSGYNALSLAAEEWQAWLGNAKHLPTTIDEVVQLCEASAHLTNKLTHFVVPMRDIQQQRQRADNTPQQTLTAWLDWLYDGSTAALAAWQDDAVAQVLKSRLQLRAAGEGAKFSGEEFLLWLQDVLAAEVVVDNEVESRVVFVEHGGYGNFSALVLLGYAGTPVRDDNGWLGEKERAILGLPLRQDKFIEHCRQFATMLAAHKRIAAVWCNTDEMGNAQLPNPLWRLFATQCRAAGSLQELQCDEDTRTAAVQPPRATAAVAAAMPRTLALTAADELMRCPYAFYVNRLLKLQDSEGAVTDDVPPMLAGTLLHAVMEAFSAASRDLQTPAELTACLHRVLDEKIAGNRPALSLLHIYWRNNTDAFIEWELQRRAAGWQTVHREHRVETMLPLPNGQEIKLSGRIDRWDSNINGEGAVIDYKSGHLASKKELATGERPQLPLYAFFAAQQEGAPIIEKMLYRPLYKQTSTSEDSSESRRVLARLRQVLRQISTGTPLPANGTAEACSSCSAAGVCRREHWSESHHE